MRPRWSAMLQHNNNNNYPCLSGSAHEAPLKCSAAAVPFPSRLEMGLGDLPLIRGLRAWVLCSKSRQKGGGGPAAGGRAPATPPAGRRTSCPRPADVHLGGGWGRTGYGLPLDARQAGLGALVTVATLKTCEGNGKTQTQCLFLRNDKGSCLYSTAKPASGGTTGVGGWLRGKSGAARRDAASSLQTEARGGVRSGRRWRKSGHAAGREKKGKGEEPEGEAAKKQEVGLEQQHDGGACKDREGHLERCRHDSNTQVEEDRLRGGVPTSQEVTAINKRREEEREEEEGGEEPNPDLESAHMESGRSNDWNMKDKKQDLLLPAGEEVRDVAVTEPSRPAGGSTGKDESETCWVRRAPGSKVAKWAAPPGHVDDSGHLERVGWSPGGDEEDDWTLQETALECRGRKGGGVSPLAPRLHNPAPSVRPPGAMATSLPRVDAAAEGGGGPDGREVEHQEVWHEEEEEDEFGVFMQAEGGAASSQGVAMSAPVPCGNSAALGESSDWTPTWTGSPIQHPGDAWAAFPQDARGEGRHEAGLWWPEEERRGADDHNLAGLFASAFPPLPDSTPRDPGDPDVIPTLTQLLVGSGGQEQRLLGGFADISKMRVHRYKGGSGGVSRDLLLRSLHVEPPGTVTCWSNRRPSPGLHSANQHAAAKRRLSCDNNASVTD
ncbi:uncharacterized protein si:ch211-14c7.2 [Entelurus aequoreus]|uniref:uncharacterized protein si:ch211-14c7.2 n=1 Tax=Entelurus aequoreus TaxID=161455 RepID=UPI002B1D8F64|nr:uncharacterized protein si:ch211-14c7.2 [Entelurus aequoreus]